MRHSFPSTAATFAGCEETFFFYRELNKSLLDNKIVNLNSLEKTFCLIKNKNFKSFFLFFFILDLKN